MLLVGLADIINFGDVQPVDYIQVIYNLLWVFGLSLVILFTYKFSYQTTVYNRSFAIALPITAMVTTIIIITVASNLILSLGMVGALSIVRFRTALKNPFDTVFMFWAVGLGITMGASLPGVAIIGTLSISAFIFGLIALEMFVSSYFLIIRADSTVSEEEVLEEVKSIYNKYTLRNKTIKDNSLDLTIEVRSKADKSIMVNRIKDIKGVKSVILLSHQGDYISE